MSINARHFKWRVRNVNLNAGNEPPEVVPFERGNSVLQLRRGVIISSLAELSVLAVPPVPRGTKGTTRTFRTSLTFRTPYFYCPCVDGDQQRSPPLGNHELIWFLLGAPSYSLINMLASHSTHQTVCQRPADKRWPSRAVISENQWRGKFHSHFVPNRISAVYPVACVSPENFRHQLFLGRRFPS